MTVTRSLQIRPDYFEVHAYKANDRLPLKSDYLWRVESGVVRTLTWLGNGNVVTLGLWGTGDVVSRQLSSADPLEAICLTAVEVTLLSTDVLPQITSTLVQQLHQCQSLLQILHRRPVEVALWELLIWLSQKFGQAVEQGQLIEFHLTHQEIAETIGTTRVTVTRLLKEFEQQNLIQRLPSHQILIQDTEPLWYYEI